MLVSQVLPGSALRLVDLRDNLIGTASDTLLRNAATGKLGCEVMLGSSAPPKVAQAPAWKSRISKKGASTRGSRLDDNRGSSATGAPSPRAKGAKSKSAQKKSVPRHAHHQHPPAEQPPASHRQSAPTQRQPREINGPPARRAADRRQTPSSTASQSTAESRPTLPQTNAQPVPRTTTEDLAAWLDSSGATESQGNTVPMEFAEADRVLAEQASLVRQRRRDETAPAVTPNTTTNSTSLHTGGLPPPARLFGLCESEEEIAAAIRATFGHLDNLVDQMARQTAGRSRAAVDV